MGSVEESLPFWQVNVPPEKRETECPAYLSKLSIKDQEILGTRDSAYTVLDWARVQEIIHANQLQLFQRVPSQLRRYLAYTAKLKADFGSVMQFVVSQRLGWETPIVPRGRKPFEVPEDVKVLWNDWPYGIDERIVHLVVWTKFDLQDDPQTDDLTPQARSEIQEFVDATFTDKVGKDKVIWFKNWKSLKSVHAVEHFHVMLYDVDPKFVEEVTNGDVPLSRKV